RYRQLPGGRPAILREQRAPPVSIVGAGPGAAERRQRAEVEELHLVGLACEVLVVDHSRLPRVLRQLPIVEPLEARFHIVTAGAGRQEITRGAEYLRLVPLDDERAVRAGRGPCRTSLHTALRVDSGRVGV